MQLSENEKRMLYQMEGYGLEDVIRDLRASAVYAPRREQRETAENLMQKFHAMPEEESWGLVMEIRRNYHIPGGAKTVGEMLAETRQKAAYANTGAAQEGWMKGHDIMALERFADDMHHMIVFDVLSGESDIGDPSDRMRLFLTEEGYRKLQGEQEKGNVKIRKHARVLSGGRLSYDRKGMER